MRRWCVWLFASILLLQRVPDLRSRLEAADPGREARPPNFVVIFIDDMGFADPSCFGNPHVKTARIDRLAAEGLRLTNFYVNSPICSPSRVALTTGQYPARWKIHSYLNTRAGNRARGMRDYLDSAAPTTAKKLKSAGYATAHFGKWHMGGGRDVDDAPLPRDYGFDESLVAFEGLGDRLLTDPRNASASLGHGKIEYCERFEKTEKYTDRAIDFVRRHRDSPFYLRLFPNDVHDPHVPRPGDVEKWNTVTSNPWEQKFFAVLEELDRQIGRLVDAIDEAGLAESTLIVFTSDNGPTDWPSYYRGDEGGPPGSTGPYFGRKWSLFEGGIRMPFIARWKGRIAAGTTDETSVVAAIDLSPTFCRLAGVPVPAAERLDGLDRADVLLGRPSARSRPVFWQYGAPHAVLRPGRLEFQSPALAVRDGAWKLLVNPDGSDAQLYQLESDPGEQRSLLVTERERAERLQVQLGDWALDVGLEFDSKAALTAPAAALALLVDGQQTRVARHGVEVLANGAWRFDGNSWLELPRRSAPRVSGSRSIRIRATIRSESPDGVILAHGGDRTGYALYLRKGHLNFATCVDWKRTVILATESLGEGEHVVEALRAKDGSMRLEVDGQIVARGTAPGVFDSEPGDSLEVATDLVKPVGEYEVPARFRGQMRDLEIRSSP